jgi:hypothetical protein
VGAVWDEDAVQRMGVNLTCLFPRVRASNRSLCCACIVVLSVFLIADLFVPHLDQGCGVGDVEAGASIREPVVTPRAFEHKRYTKSCIAALAVTVVVH